MALFEVTAYDKKIYEEELKEEGQEEYEKRKENIDELLSKIASYEESCDEEPTLSEFLEEVALVADIDSLDENSDYVVLMTLHSAKGLEFPEVYLTGLEDGMFPSYMTITSDDPTEVEEERRLCYVGITRAMKRLYLTAATRRMINGTTNYNDISRFVKEIPRHYVESEGVFVSKNSYEHESVTKPANSFGGFSNIGYGRPKMNQGDYGKSNPYVKNNTNPSANPGFGKAFPMGNSNNSADYKVGDTVKHLKFGKGKVISVVSAGSDQEITVDFERVGEKKMFASLVKMKKL